MRLLAELSLPHLRTRAPVRVVLVGDAPAEALAGALEPFYAYHLLHWPDGLPLPDGSSAPTGACLRLDGYFEAADALAHLLARAEPSVVALLMLAPPAAPVDFARCMAIAWDVTRAHYRTNPERWSTDASAR